MEKHNCIQETNIALLNNNMKYMQNDIEEIKNLLKNFIVSADNKFATKTEYKGAKIRLDRIEKLIIGIALFVFSIIGTGIVYNAIIYLSNNK